MPLELSEAFVGHLEALMLAQAQECAWQRAVMGKLMLLSLERTARLMSCAERRQLQKCPYCKVS